MGLYGVAWVGKMVGFSIKFLVISNIRKVLYQFCVDVDCEEYPIKIYHTNSS